MKVVLSLVAITAAAAATNPIVVANCSGGQVQYQGIEREGVEIFFNIPYAQDTGGKNRFKPPRSFSPVPGTIYDATKAGPACPQSLGQWNVPLTLNNITEISENCLNLNIARPKSNGTRTAYPVMVWIHGGK